MFVESSTAAPHSNGVLATIGSLRAISFSQSSVILKLLLLLLPMVIASTARADDWPTFRGVSRTAVASDVGLLDEWGSDGPRLLWTAHGAGKGYASPAVAGGAVYTLGDNPSTAKNDGQYLTSYDFDTGKQRWIVHVGPAWLGHPGQPSWNGARGTPTIDGDRVYVLNADGTLYCVSTDGKMVWQKSLTEEFGGKKHDSWGYGESPLIDGNALICTPGGDKATVVALDKISGKLIWKCTRRGDVGAGHSSVVISQIGDKKVYVQNTASGPIGIDAQTGELLWTYNIPAPIAFIPTPIVKDDFVFTVAGYGTGGALLKQIVGKDGGISVEEIYGLNRDLTNKHGGVILVGDHLYAGREDSNVLYCADLLTGDVHWKKRGSGSGSTSVISADGKLFVRFQNGIVALAKATPSNYQEVSSFQTPGSGDRASPSWAHPVIVDGKLLLREADAILCYDIKK